MPRSLGSGLRSLRGLEQIYLRFAWVLEPFLSLTHFYELSIPCFVPEILYMGALRIRMSSGLGLDREGRALPVTSLPRQMAGGSSSLWERHM